MAVQPGEVYTNEKGTQYKVLDKKEWFCGFVPIGTIESDINKGIKVVLVNAPHERWVKY